MRLTHKKMERSLLIPSKEMIPSKKAIIPIVLLLSSSFAVLFLFGLMQPQDAHASKLGRVFFSGNPDTSEGQTCTTCHSGGQGDVTLSLSGPTEVNSGETVSYTVVISGGPAVVGGLDISVQDNAGTLAAIDEFLQIIDNELTHTEPHAFENGELAFTFNWTAPNFGTTLTMYAAGLSGNNDNVPLGDSVGQNTLTVNVSGPEATPTPQPTVSPVDTVQFDLLRSGFSNPVDIQNAGDGRLFIVEQAGRVQIIDANGELASESFLNIEGRVDDSQNEMGLLGLAFHPDYASNGYFYVNYTASSPRHTVISRFSVSDNADVADPESELILLEFDQPRENHNGGQVRFGPDGYLYISSGDGGGSGDPFEAGQDNSMMLGKILRIDVDKSGGSAPDCRGEGVTGDNYTVPSDNPFVDGAGSDCDEIWATGMRNPWRFSFDALTGDLWIGDVGQGAQEEIDYQPASSNGGENYGWHCYEGNSTFDLDDCSDRSSYVFPVYEYSRNGGRCSVTGGIVYRGQDYPGLYGQYIFADFCKADLWSLRGTPTNPDFTEFNIDGNTSLSSPTAFGEDHRGELYVASRGGRIFQIKTNEVVATPTAAPTQIMPSATPIVTTTATISTTMTPMPSVTSTPMPSVTPTPGTVVLPDPTPLWAILTVDARAGGPDSGFIFSAIDLAPETDGTIHVNGTEVGAITTGADGSIQFHLTTEDLAAGYYIVELTVGTNRGAASIQLDDSAPVRSPSGQNIPSFGIPSSVDAGTALLVPTFFD